MTKKIGTYKVPFVDGNMQEYVGGWQNHATSRVEWRDNVPFTAKLKLDGHWRGRSSARVGVIDEATGAEYSMGFASFYDAVEAGDCVGGYIEGTWQVKKQGANFILVKL